MTGETRRLNRSQAIDLYRPGSPRSEYAPKTDLVRELGRLGYAQIELGIPMIEYQRLSDQYEMCYSEYPQWLEWTAGNFDRYGIPEDGHVQKDLHFNNAGMQIEDPKKLFHYNNSLWQRWSELPGTTAPEGFREFMERGFAIKHELTRKMKMLIETVAEDYPGLDTMLFPDGESATTLRVLIYDGYKIRADDGSLIVKQHALVAKDHYDRGVATAQVYASHPGFYLPPDALRPEKVYPPYGENQSQMFFGAGFRAVYGSDSYIKPLYHGVERIFDESLEYMPPRVAIILFVDPPYLDLDIRGSEAQPNRVDKENLT